MKAFRILFYNVMAPNASLLAHLAECVIEKAEGREQITKYTAFPFSH